MGRFAANHGDLIIAAVGCDLFVCYTVEFAVPRGPVAPRHKVGVEPNDVGTGPVVDGERDAARLSPQVLDAPLRKLNKVFYSCTPKTVEGLIVVADNANVLVPRCQSEKEPFLDCVGVLVFVNDDVSKDVARALKAVQYLVCPLLKQGKIREGDSIPVDKGSLVPSVERDQEIEVSGAEPVALCVGSKLSI
jgi:hypothetical protein